MGGEAEPHIDGESEEGCGEGYTKVGQKLVLEPYALRARGYDSRIGDEGEVVTKEATTHHTTYHHACPHVQAICHSGGNGYKGSYRTYTRTYAETYEAGSQKHAGQKHGGWHYAQGELHCGIDGTHSLGGGGKGACQQEYPHHEQQV